MTKIAVVTDSNSGITQAQAIELGIYVVPMPFTIDNTNYYEDVNLTQEKFYSLLTDGACISTSQPAPDALLSLWDELLKTHEQIVHIPMSSGLSGACQSAAMLAQDYDGRVQVVDNQRISVTQRQSALDAKFLVQKGMNAQEIKEFLEKDKFNSSIYIMLDTLYYLKKGGRITPAAAAIGTMLKIKPVLTIQGEKLDAFAKVRTVSQGKATMINAVKNDIDKRFGGLGNPKGVQLYIAYTHDREMAVQFQKELGEQFPGYDIHIDPLSLSVACHIGPGALGIGCTKNFEIYTSDH